MRHTGIARDCTSDLAGHNGDLLAVKGLTMLMAGRVEERLLLERTLEAAAGEVPSAVLVHGEAGVGKTRLVTQACGDARARGFTTIWGSCVRVGAIEAPYHPLVKGLEAWAQDASDADRAAVLGSFRSVEEFLAAPERKESTGLAGRLVAIERLVELIAQRSPTVLVLDDLQWADLASRDLLAYLVAGFHRQRLAILGTYRDEGLGQEGMFRGWLADLTRLPAVEDLGLARLTAAETEEQVRLITGSAPHPALVAELLERSAGNAYFTELLVKGLPSGAERLPGEVPEALGQALLAAWHRLDRPARDVLGILAVAGRPATAQDVAQVAASLRLDPTTCLPGLRDAEDVGIVVRERPDRFWFRHPLLVEVLEGTMTTAEATPVHAAWARRLEDLPDGAVDELARQGDLARHRESSGDHAGSLEASLRAADLAEGIGAVREVAGHLRRAARLTASLPDAEDRDGEVALLERTAYACERVGEGAAALAAWSRALELTDAEAEPLRASRLVVEHANAAWKTGVVKDKPVAEMAHAVGLTGSAPRSAEHAIALAELSRCESWSGLAEDALRHARASMAAASRSGSSLAVAQANVALAQALGRTDEAEEAILRGVEAARQSGDAAVLNLAEVFRVNLLHDHGRHDLAADEGLESVRHARSAGDLSRAAFVAGMTAKDLLACGRLAEAAELVREGLSLPGVSNSVAMARLAATVLAVRHGELATADLHLERARELIPKLEERPGLEAPPLLAEHLLAHGQCAEAVGLLSGSLDVQAVDPLVVDDMLVWGARSVADWAERARDRRDTTMLARARSAMAELLERRGRLGIPPPFEGGWEDDRVRPARRALFEAERLRCDEGAAPSSAWARAVEACEQAGMRWEGEVSRWRLAQALSREGARTAVVAEQLRTAHRFALATGAVPLDRQVRVVAQAGGIRLDEPELPSAHEPAAGPLASLTEREREVLAHLVAGRTYSEIASALVISEKTVSSHVSHLLSKTDTRSRRELAELAQRLEAHGPR
jgi:DNA-binding CsgD family transcriptional regulator/tetratricopeptide (TPR) repeat protein